MTDRELMQQALEGLVDAQLHNYALKHKETDDLIATLRERLTQPEPIDLDALGIPHGHQFQPAAQPEQPAEWQDCNCADMRDCDARCLPKQPQQEAPQRTHWEGCEEVHPECRKPRREWVGLTDREIEQIARYQDEHGSGPWHLEFARAIEAKLKERNQ